MSICATKMPSKVCRLSPLLVPFVGKSLNLVQVSLDARVVGLCFVAGSRTPSSLLLFPPSGQLYKASSLASFVFFHVSDDKTWTGTSFGGSLVCLDFEFRYFLILPKLSYSENPPLSLRHSKNRSEQDSVRCKTRSPGGGESSMYNKPCLRDIISTMSTKSNSFLQSHGVTLSTGPIDQSKLSFLSRITLRDR
jgi:hypothetical protein